MNTADITNWAIETVFNLIILAEGPNAKSLTEKNEFTFRPLCLSAGKCEFTKLEFILNPANGFVGPNGAVKFKVSLEIEKIHRKKT